MSVAAGITRAAIVAEVATWIGTPYRHQASLKGVGCDCLGLVRGVWRALYGAEPEPLPPYTADWAEPGDRLLAAARRHFREREPGRMRSGDLLVFRWRPAMAAKHVGILLADDLTLGNIGVVDGTAVTVRGIPLAEARSVEVAGDEVVSNVISPDMLRRALLGKVVTAGDNISLLPQDHDPRALASPADLEATRRQLRNAMGLQYTTMLLT